MDKFHLRKFFTKEVKHEKINDGCAGLWGRRSGLHRLGGASQKEEADRGSRGLRGCGSLCRCCGWLGLVSDDGIHQLLEFQIHGDRRRLENLCDTEDAVALHDDMGWLSRVGNGHWCVKEGKAIGTTILLARDNLGGKATDWSKCGEN